MLRRRPDVGRRLLRRRALPPAAEGYAVDTHFAPRYDPWDQRLCVAPDGDLFDVLSDGRAEVVTDTVERLDARRHPADVRRHLPADLVVTATGLRLEVGGGAEVEVDGEPVDVSRGHVYKGLMLSDVPNVALAVGYTNASWTLRADLSARWFCSLVRFMERQGVCRRDAPLRRATGGASTRCSTCRRATSSGPPTCCRGRGSGAPWRVVQSYVYDLAGHAAGPDRRRAPRAALTALRRGPAAADRARPAEPGCEVSQTCCATSVVVGMMGRP